MSVIVVLPLAAQGIKLSGLPGQTVVGDVQAARSSADGEWIVYQADQEIDGILGLYSVPAKGDRDPARLDESPGIGSPSWFAIAPDSRTVAFASEGTLYGTAIDGGRRAIRLSSAAQQVLAYRAPQFTPDGGRVVYSAYVGGIANLYVVPIDGSGPPRRLNERLPPGGRVESFRIDARGRRVVYLASGDQPNAYTLYSVPLVESAGRARPRPVRLNSPLPSGNSVSLFQLTPDGRGVVYLGDQERRGQFELFLVGADGSGAPRKLNAPLPRAGLDVEYDFALSSDGARVLYRAPYSNATARKHLYSVPLDGSQEAVALNEEVERDGLGSFSIDPTSRLVVYLADQVDSAQGRELFVVPIDRSAAPRRLSGPLGEEGRIYTFQIDAAGERAVYIAARETEDGVYVTELFSAVLRRPSVVELGDGFLPSVSGFQISPDSRRAVVVTYGGLARELYSLALDGTGEPTSISGPPFQAVQGFSISPRGDRVHFIADRDTLDAFELYTVPIEGQSEPRKLNDPLVTAPSRPSDVYSFEFSSDGSQAVYFVNGCDPDDECDEGHSPDGLHVVPTDASSGSTQLYPPPVPGIVRLDDAYPFRISPDGRRLVFAAGYPGSDGYDELMELYSAPLDGSLLPVRLNGPVVSEEDVRQFELTPGGATVVFVAASKLYVASIEGGAPPTGLAPSETVGSFSLTPDGARAVFRVVDAGGGYALKSVLLDGSQPPVQLGEPLAPGWFLLNLAFTRDGGRLVYRTGPYPPRLDTPSEIHSVPVDGSSPPIRLGGPLVAGGDFTALLLDPDGSRAVYLADQEVDQRFELYSVPVDGSASPLKLSGPLVAGGDVSNGINAKGGRVVYVADQEVDEQFELYGVPIDASAAPVKLNGSFPGFADVRAFQLDAAGTRVVYVADALGDEVFELFSVVIDGSAAPIRLNSPFVDGGDVASPYSGQWSFQITPDGESVLYVADQRSDDVFELFGVPIDGGASADRLSAPLVSGGDVASFQASPDSGRVLYLADQDVDGLQELYASLLTLRAQRGR